MQGWGDGLETLVAVEDDRVRFVLQHVSDRSLGTGTTGQWWLAKRSPAIDGAFHSIFFDPETLTEPLAWLLKPQFS